MDMHQLKQERLQERMALQAELTKMHLYSKEDNSHRVNKNKTMAYTRTKQEAIETKQDKQMNREIWQE